MSKYFDIFFMRPFCRSGNRREKKNPTKIKYSVLEVSFLFLFMINLVI